MSALLIIVAIELVVLFLVGINWVLEFVGGID